MCIFVLPAQYIPPEKVHPKLFPKRWIKPDCYPTLVRRKWIISKQNKPPTEEEKKTHRRRIQAKLQKTLKVLSSMGVEYTPLVYDPYYVPGEYPAVLVDNVEDKKESTSSQQDTTPAEFVETSKSQASPAEPQPSKPSSPPQKATTKTTKKTAVKSVPVSTPENPSPVKTRASRATRQSIASSKPSTEAKESSAGSKAPISRKRASTTATLSSPAVGRKKK